MADLLVVMGCRAAAGVSRRVCRRGVPLVVVVLLLLWAGCVQPASALRYSPVIGNAAYVGMPLVKLGNDACDMAVRLEALSFEVTRVEDANFRELVSATDAFQRRARATSNRVALVHYLGIGINVDGQNHLIPADAQLRDEKDVRSIGLALDRLLEGLGDRGAGARNLVILDADRTNWFGEGEGLDASGRRGLARVSVPPDGTLVMYATRPGSMASDNPRSSDGAASVPTLAAAQPNLDLEVWRSAEACSTPACLQAYLESYPQGAFAAIARARLAALPATEVTASTSDAPTLAGELVAIPGGCFQMGSPASEEGRYDDERQHRVCVEPFRIGKTEVTQAQWRAVMGSNPSSNQGCDDCPVEQVSWDDVQAFLSKLNNRTGGNYRLPTEAEWEYACRGGRSGETYCGGNDVDAVAWYVGNSGRFSPKPKPVGRKRANGYGLHDMSGNVWEWTCSEYDEEYGGGETRCISGANANERLLVFRGGSWPLEPADMRSAYRTAIMPDYRVGLIGFRLAQD